MRPATVSSLLALTALASVPVSVPYYASPFTKPSQAHNTQMAQQTTQGAPREIDFPYYSLRDGYSSLLQLVSDSPVSLPIEVTIRSSSGRNILKKDMNISSQEKLMIELQSLVASLNGESEDDFQEGSISVRYASDTRPIMGQITVTNPYLNLIFESRLAINDPGDSNIPAVLEGIWWGLKPGRQTKVMVANTSNSSVTADVSLTFRGQRHLGALISFAPYETKVLSIRELLAKFNADTEFVSEGGITITGHSPSPVLIASGMTADLNSGFSTTMHFPPAGTPQTSTLLAPGVPIGTPSAESPFALAGTFTPHVVVRNLSSSPQTATVSVEYPTASGTQLITLDPINLAAYATKDVALDSTVQDRLPLPLPYCSIQVKNSGSPGSAVAEISSVAHNQDLVVDSKLGDPTDRLSGSGINPWHLDDQTESVLFLANESDAPARVAFQIQAQRTIYHLTDLKLNPHETRAIDIRKLRDAQKPDMFGNTIPAKATDGSLFWVKMDRVPMIGRTLVFSSHKGISSNFDCSCTLHCPQGYLALSVAPSSATMTINGTQQFTATESWGDCSGIVYYYDQTTSSTWTSNSSACTVGNNGLGSSGIATAIEPGSATITASYTDDAPHWSAALQDCIDRYIQRSASATATVKPRIDSISPALGAVGSTVSVTLNGNGLSAATVSAGSGITVTVSSSTNTQIQASFAISASATGGNHAVTVTANGQTSGSVNFYVQIPAKLVFFNTACAPGGQGQLQPITNGTVVDCGGVTRATNFCGVNRNLTYQLVDQSVSRNPFPVAYSLSESFSNLSTTNPALGLPTPSQNIPIGVNQYVTDAQFVGFTYPKCLGSNDHHSYNQNFSVSVGGVTYNLSTTVSISNGNFNGTLRDDVTISIP